MLNQEAPPDAMALYRAAADRAMAVVDAVRPQQLASPTPCCEWTVQQLIDHLVGGSEYLMSAADYRRGVGNVVATLQLPSTMEETCLSPLGFEWPLSQAVAGTFMDVLIHTWDLARATGQDEKLDPALVEACTAMFLPDMPERGRAAGIIGPAVDVGDDASPQDRLLAAMGRRP